ncbi:sensor histidine kinase [Yinghuangia seranimata]|uniref:sensor histidine kinase n=1 Tax=Yinghuangia seranimata TaxID=408067 RepID=UPI00248C4A9A|nr:histidine kinase [Yinghuangia seranimata]MDI2132019.1 histidine kinase [Yinghuangia seranimata]
MKRRPFSRPVPPVVFDRIFAGGFTVLIVAALAWAGWTERHEGIAATEWIKAAMQIASTVALFWRRAHPIAVGLACGLLSLPEQAVATPFAMYAVGRYVEDRTKVWFVVVPVSVVWAQPWAMPSTGDRIGNILIGLAPALYGLYVASRNRLIAALAERAERAEREQELRAEQARSEERERLAGEMHDVVTHRVSLMVLQAGALRTRAPDQAVRDAAEDLRLVGCQALEELRNLVTILRNEDRFGTSAAAEPAELDLSRLVAESRTAGVDVRLSLEGAMPPASPVVVRTAYRIVQESLTNVHKHAPGASVGIHVRHSEGWLRIQVVNTAATGPCELVFPGEGTGLTGLRQRVEMVKGSLRAGPTGDGGFAVAADLPVATAAGTPAQTPSGAR